MAKSTNKVVKGAAVIGIAGIIVKIMGGFFRIPLTNWIGDEGMSYYGFAYNIYGALLVLATAGFPVAISRLVSESIAKNEYKNAHKIFVTSMKIMVTLGIIFSGVCFFAARQITGFFGNPDAAPALKAIAPALLIVPMQASFRGYFQGRQNMNPTAVSEIMEQFVRVITGLLLAYHFMKVGLAQAAAGAAFGAAAGTCASLVLLLIIYFGSRNAIHKKIDLGNQKTLETIELAKKIIYIAVPIIIGAELVPIMNIIDMGVIMKRLQATGWSYQESKEMYGLISGFCVPLIAIPQIFTQAVSVSLVPAISRAAALDNHEEVNDNIALGYRITSIMAFPCALGILALAEPILFLLYPMQKESASAAAPTLMILAVTVLTLAASQTSTGILQALGRQTVPVKNLFIGCIFKVVITFVLVGIPGVNIKGAAIGTFVAEAISFVLNDRAIVGETGAKIRYSITYIRPAIAAGVMGLVVFGVHTGCSLFIGNSLSTLIAIMIGVLIYLVLIFKLKAITLDEVAKFPKGEKLAKVIEKIIR